MLRIVRNASGGNYICLEGGDGDPLELEVGQVKQLGDSPLEVMCLPDPLWNDDGEEVVKALKMIWDALATK